MFIKIILQFLAYVNINQFVTANIFTLITTFIANAPSQSISPVFYF